MKNCFLTLCLAAFSLAAQAQQYPAKPVRVIVTTVPGPLDTFARITGPQIAWNKAFTAAGHKRSTHLFTKPPGGPALPGNEAFGIQLSFEGRFAAFVGGFPIVVNDEVVGGVGLSGGNGEQDTRCGLAALQALKELLAPQGYSVVVEADIKK